MRQFNCGIFGNIVDDCYAEAKNTGPKSASCVITVRHIELAVEACPYGFETELHKEDEMPLKTALYPALVDWNGHNGLPKFDAVKDEDFA